MATPLRGAIVLVLTGLLALVTRLPADGEVPTSADVAACNEQAPHDIRTSASPTTGDHVRAERARGATTMNSPGSVIESADPQIHGMQGEGARDPAYQAAYRSCMRRRGF